MSHVPIVLQLGSETPIVVEVGVPGPRGAPATTPVAFTTAEAIAIGEPIAFDTAGDVLRADATFSASRWQVAGIAVAAAAPAASVNIQVVQGVLVSMLFSSAPAAGANGSPVYLSDTAGRATLTPSTSSGAVRFLIGILQGADGVSTSPDVLFTPQWISRIP